MAPLPQQMQFSQNANGANPTINRQPAGQSALPTLTAFDLSSLANQAQAAFRRVAPQAQQQQQQANFEPQTQRNNLAPNMNRVPNAAQQHSAGGGAAFVGAPFSSQTELPFVRQVFRPAAAPGESGPERQPSAEERVSRPTPPPLFVPARPTSKVPRVVESGFAPMQAAANGVASAPTQPTGREQVFFEPSSAARLQEQAAAERRRPAQRRPSQRPQAAGPARQAPGARTSDVIRLASSAIQTANEGLAAIGSLQDEAASSVASAPASGSPPLATESPQASALGHTEGLASSSGAAGPGEGTPSQLASTSSSPAPTFEPATPSAQATGAESASPQSGRRAAPPPPLRTNANFFALTNLATSSPTSFSPALPINAAVAAAGGRRRIPVRSQQNSATSQHGRAQTTTPSASSQQPTTQASSAQPRSQSQESTTAPLPTSGQSVRRPEIEEFYETIGNGFASTLNAATTIDGFGSQSRAQQSGSSTPAPSQPASEEKGASTTTAADLYGSRLSATAGEQAEERGQQRARPSPQPQPQSRPDGQQAALASLPQAQQDGPLQLASPVMVPVTYMTTLTYLTTVLHGTHTLQTSHESVVRSTELATLNAQLMDQIEHRRPLVQPTATLSVSSKTKGKGTTIVNLKSAVSAYNQELVEALGAGQSVQATGTLSSVAPSSELPAAASERPKLASNKFRGSQQQQQPARPLLRASRTVDLSELQEARKSLLTEYVYLYTMKPLDGLPSRPEITSVRSELVTGSVDGNELAAQLMAASAGAHLIDSNGLLRINQETAPLNLGKLCNRRRVGVGAKVCSCERLINGHANYAATLAPGEKSNGRRKGLAGENNRTSMLVAPAGEPADCIESAARICPLAGSKLSLAPVAGESSITWRPTCCLRGS